MNLQQLRYVVATVDAGTMTAAAGQLNVAQPALSRAIKALEGELQVQIFEPAGRRVRLTSAGDDIARAARAVLAAVDQVDAVARSHAERPEPLVVVTTPTLEPLFARHFLPEYYARHSDATARIQRAAGRDEIEASVLAGDAMIGLTDLPVTGELCVEPLGELEIVLLSPPGSSVPDVIPPAALDGMRFILPSVGSTRRLEYDGFFELLQIRPVVALESDERASWLEGVLAGIGSVLWHGERAASAIERGARLSHFDPPLRRSVGLVHRPDHLPRGALDLIDLAREVGLPTWAFTRLG